MFREPTLIIALALCLVCLAPARAASGAAPAPQTPRSLVIHYPRTFICDPPSGPGEQRQPIPPGKKIEDLCPPGAHAYLFNDPGPIVSGLPPPLPKTASPQEAMGASATEGNLHKPQPKPAAQSP